MARGVLIIGPSGSGKTYSTKFVDPKSTFIIQMHNKDLPYRNQGYKRVDIGTPPTKITTEQLDAGIYEKIKDYNMTSTTNAFVVSSIYRVIEKEMPHIKRIIIDDWQYASASLYMERAEEKSFDKFTKIGKDMWTIAKLPEQGRDDLIVYYFIHDQESTDADGNRTVRAKTIGKLIDNMITLEGMFMTVIYTHIKIDKDKKPVYTFMTVNSGNNTAKTPEEMFEMAEIPNNLDLLDTTIREYYNVK